MAAPVTKIYQLETLGFDPLHKELQQISKDFAAIKKAKKEAEAGLGAASTTADAAKYRAELAKIRLEEAELRKQRQQMLNEAKAEQLARQAAIREEKERGKAAQATSGWYKVLTTDIRELGTAIKGVDNIGDNVSFRGQTLQFDAAIAKLKELTAAEQAFRRQFAKDQTLVGEYTTGIVNAFKQMGLDDLIAGQVTRTQDTLNKLNVEFNELQKELRETQAAGLKTDSIEKQMIENRNEVIKLDTALERLRVDLRGVGDIGNQINTSLAKGFGAVKGQLSSLVVQYLGVQAAISEAQQGIQDAKISSDQFTDLEIQLNNDAVAADKLNDALKALDTRTTLTGLQQIADVALRAGTTSENIASVTEAIDKTKVAFGKDFGSVEQGTETFAKLINIFFEDGQITGERILNIGNAVRALANETVASVPFLNDFAGRMAGLRQITNITLPDVLGLGAGFEEFKQSAEVASTVLVKLIPKLATDTEKFAGIVGITQAQFSELLQNNPAEALIAVSEALVKSGKGIEDVSDALADSELGSGRITTIIGTLGGKADIFRQRIARAGETIQETGAITDAFAKKNNNLAASIDKSSKKVSDFFASTGFQSVLAVIFGLLTLIIGNLPIIISLVGLLTVNWIAQNAVLLGLRAQLILYNLAIGANLIALNALRLVNIVYTATLFLLNGALGLVTRALAFFNITLKASSGPLGVILAIAGLLATAFAAFGRILDTATNNLSNFVRLQRINAEVNREASRAISEQVSRVDGWVAVIKSATTSADTKRKAMEELIKIDTAFSGVIKDNVVDLNALNKAYETVIGSIKAKARAEAAATLSAGKQQRVQEIAGLRQELEISSTQSQGATVFTVDLTDQQRAILKASNLVETGAIVSIGKNSAQIFGSRFDQIKKFLDQKELEAINTYKDYLEVQAQTQEELNKIETQVSGEQQKTAQTVSKQFEVDISFLKKQIDDLNKQIEKFQGSKADLAKLINDRTKLQAQLDKLLGQNKSTGSRGSKLSGDQKDAQKDIDAIRDEELARLNKSFLDQTAFQRRIRELLQVSEDGKIALVKQSQAVLIRDEETFLLESFEINTKAINDKLALLKGANAEERKQIAQLNLEKINLEKETNDKIFEIRAKRIKDQMDITVSNAQEGADRIIRDPDVNIPETTRAQAQLDADKVKLDAQILFNQQMDALEKDRNNVSKKNEEDRARALRQITTIVTEDQKKAVLAQIEDVKKAGEKLQAEFELNIDRAILLVQADTNLSQAQKNSKIRLLEREREFGILVRQAAQFKQLEEVFKAAYDAGVVTLQQYEEVVKKLAELQGKIADSPQMNDVKLFKNLRIEFGEDVTSYVVRAFDKLGNDLAGKEIGKKLFGKVLSEEEAKAMGDAFASVVGQSFALAQEVMNSYFDAEEARIQRSLEVQLQRIEIDQEQAKARAQSIAETESIEKQYASRKKQAEREAFNKTKELKKKEAKIALATELANIWSSVWSVGVPWVAIVLGVLMSALALGRYSTRINDINSQSYAMGGKPGEQVTGMRRTITKSIGKGKGFAGKSGEVPVRGGKFKGKEHKDGGAPFKFKGKQYEAEVDELAVIRTRNAPKNKKFKVEGTQMEIASAINRIGGGIDFKPGARVNKFETGGFIGQNLQAPIFTPASAAVVNGRPDIEMLDKFDQLADAIVRMNDATDRRIDRLQVNQVTNTVTDAQKKAVRQTNVGTL